jgi:propionate CoA-transferase
MTLWDRAWILSQLARELLTWVCHDTRYPSPVPDNPKFMSPRTAVGLIGDGDVVAVSGLGGNQRAAIMFWAIAETFEGRGHPAGLTVMNLGGHGGRGRAPGTLEELGRRGLCRRLITGHFETFRAMLDLAAAGECELQCLPQGTLALLIDALGRGEDSLLSATGIGTFLDPRVGSGSPVAGRGEHLITVEGDRLRYRIPAIDVAIFNAPAADRHGNIYVTHCAMVGETAEIARAVRRNHGCVIANVGLLVDEDHDRVFLPADMVDAVVYHPDTEQAAGFPHRSYWSALTTESDVPIATALEQARFASWLAGLTPRRTSVDHAVARLAAATLTEHVGPGAHVNIGTGLPEGVCDALFTAGLHDAVTLLVESGPVGGLPAPGLFFGASLSPREIISSIDMFKLCYERLDATCLGALEADGDGNVNVSRKSDQVRDYVGPGGFIDLTAAAHTIVFVSDWMVGGEFAVDDGSVRIVRRGRPKFVARVREITFNGQRALAAGKRVWYATPVGLFRLTRRGMELTSIMPGIDVRRDVLGVASMRVVLPETDEIPVVPRSVVTGDGFTPRLARRIDSSSSRF